MIKKFLRSFVIHTFAIWFVAENIGGILYNNDFMILAFAGVALSFVEAFVRPILNILLLPFNLITLGVFRWVVNVFTLYITTLLVANFTIGAFKFAGANTAGVIFPAMEFTAFWAYVVVALTISIISSVLFWIAD